MKVVIVTGVSSGIGLATANYFAQKGNHVYGISRSRFSDKNIKHIQADVTDYNAIKKAYQDIFEMEGSIDILINNAGIGISGSIEDTSSIDAKTLLDINFMGVFHSTKAAIPLMRQSGGGKIFNISSAAAFLSIPFQSFYSASKAAINAFSAALANEVNPFNIEVCSICPGDIKTGFTKNRKKNEIDSPCYKNRIDQSVLVMEKDEQNGMDPIVAAKAIYKLSNKKRLPIYHTVGFKYKIFVILSKILPATITNKAIGSIYGFKKDK